MTSSTGDSRTGDIPENAIAAIGMAEAPEFLAMRPVSDLAFLVSRALASGPDPDTTLRLEALQAELAEIAASRETLRESARIAKAQSDVRQVFAALDPDALRNS